MWRQRNKIKDYAPDLWNDLRGKRPEKLTSEWVDTLIKRFQSYHAMTHLADWRGTFGMPARLKFFFPLDPRGSPVA